MEIDGTIYVNHIPALGTEEDFKEDSGIITISSSSGASNTAPKYEQSNEVRANRGVIGGWTITNDRIYGNDVKIGSRGYLELGTVNNIIRLDSQDATYRIWVGHATAASAPFSVTKAGAVAATSGEIGGWTLASGSLSSSTIVIDGDNDRIRSTNYVAGVSGFTIESTLVEAENIIARGIMKGTTFSYDIISAVGGQLMVANADALATDMTALDAATMTIKGDTTFANDDILVMRATTDGGIEEEWFRVTNSASAPTYTVTRDLAAQHTADNNPLWKAGTPVVKQGKSDLSSTYSGGWLRLIGEGTNSPYYSVFARTGAAYNAYTEVARMGNLNGYLGYSSDLYGFAAGDSDDYFSYDPTNGVRLNTPVNVDKSFTAGEAITAGEACGLWGYQVQTETQINADAAAMCEQDNPDTNYDGQDLFIETNEHYSPVHFPGMTAIPSATGLTILKIEVDVGIYSTANRDCYIQAKPLEAGFTEATVTWNNAPAYSGTNIPIEAAPGADTWYNSGWVEINSTDYGRIKDYGIMLWTATSSQTGTVDDEDGNAPYIKVRFTYEIQNGKAWLASGLTAKYAGGFLGIAQSTVAAEASVKVRMEGVDANQTGLTAYEDYQISDTLGAIATDDAETFSKTIGRALSTTELQIKYALGDGV